MSININNLRQGQKWDKSGTKGQKETFVPDKRAFVPLLSLTLWDER